MTRTRTLPDMPPMPIEWAVAGRALRGEIESGDLHLVAAFPGGALVAVADGLGHGPEAAAASRIAMSTLRRYPQDPLLTLMDQCHLELQRTRGAVLSLAAIDVASATLTWLGVGNVDGMLFRADRAGAPRRESLPRRGGVVGYQMPPLRTTTLAVAFGDVLIFATDGISSIYSAESPIDLDPQAAADRILDRYGKDADDALVLVARYTGAAS